MHKVGDEADKMLLVILSRFGLSFNSCDDAIEVVRSFAKSVVSTVMSLMWLTLITSFVDASLEVGESLVPFAQMPLVIFISSSALLEPQIMRTSVLSRDCDSFSFY